MSPMPFPLLASNSKSAPSVPKSTRPSKPLPCRNEARKWPHDFYVCKSETGFNALSKRLKKKELEREAFPKVFGGLKYVKTTVWKYKNFWKGSDRKLRTKFIAFGHSKDGLFSCFISAQEDSNIITSDDSSPSPIPSPSPKPAPSLLVTAALSSAPDDDGMHIMEYDEEDNSSGIEDLYHDGACVRCLFCDQLMEETQSPKLVAMRAALEGKTWPDPSTEYPGHRSAASFTVYALFCEQHRFESDHLPHTIRKGWPLLINFHALYDRICRLRPEIEEIMEEPNESRYFDIAKKRYKTANDWNRFTNGGAG